MENVDFELRGEYVALCDLLKIAGVVTSGGEGKARVDAGGVRVDGQPESRRTAKIRAGQVVECDGVRVKVRAAA
ncbi:RNA-binding S4 domain-containing protein [Methyloversatilis universalis]|uniref:RNA-binding S4 domain-containing protein n=1 Tax=Methyloversatilis universalis TaxID=378211 RepID=UPI00037A1A43|nr:RNA-binding S4 domain-containing protein [Methyloversatilis universalis]